MTTLNELKEMPADDLAQLYLRVLKMCETAMIEIKERELDGTGYLIKYPGRRPLILVRESDPRYEKVFTVAHELGHLMHKHLQDIKLVDVDEEAADRYAEDLLGIMISSPDVEFTSIPRPFHSSHPGMSAEDAAIDRFIRGQKL